MRTLLLLHSGGQVSHPDLRRGQLDSTLHRTDLQRMCHVFSILSFQPKDIRIEETHTFNSIPLLCIRKAIQLFCACIYRVVRMIPSPFYLPEIVTEYKRQKNTAVH